MCLFCRIRPLSPQRPHLTLSRRDGLSRLHYYLQLRENVLQYQQPLTEEAAFLLASNALQADLGDFSEDQHHGHYFDPAHYFPSWVSCSLRSLTPLSHDPPTGKIGSKGKLLFLYKALSLRAFKLEDLQKMGDAGLHYFLPVAAYTR